MKKLFLMRHAHAGSSDVSDYERPLTAEGKEEARRVGEFLKKLGFRPDAVFCSAARRARETADAVSSVLAYPLDRVVADRELYRDGGEELVAYLKNIDCDGNVLVVSHNPAVSECVGAFGLDDFLMRPAEGVLFDCGPSGFRALGKLQPKKG